MSESWSFIGHEMLFGSLSTVLNLLKVLIPLMIVIEILLTYNILEKISKKLEFIGKPMGMSKDAIFPLLVGVFIGVTYGAGTLMELNERKPLSKKDFALIGVFMYICHGIIETGFLFGVNGASVLVVTVGRLLLAFIVTCIFARLPYIRRKDK
ncbi:MAG: nucleoside recognition domain-containing protein [Anaerovoracaceae bacterium]